MWPMLAMMAAQMGGSFIGDAASQGDANQGNAYAQQALDQYMRLAAPSMGDMQVDLEDLRSVGQLTPEMEQSITQGDTAMKGITVDPRTKDAQMAALLELQGIGTEGGLRTQDKSALNTVINETNRNEKANRDAIMQNMQERGRGGSGFELAAMLQNNQSSADRAANTGLDVTSKAREAAIQSLMGAGQLGGQMDAREFQQKSDVAKAQDVISRFNTLNRQDVVTRNTNRANQAQQTNLANSQRIADSNTGTHNDQQAYNRGLFQQDFQNQTLLADKRSGALNSMAQRSDAAAQRTRDKWNNIGGGASKGFSTMR